MINQEDKAEFQRWPLTMTHPSYTPAVISKGYAGEAHGQPERFPPVTAIDEMTEAYYASQGYEPAGKVDPAAWAQAHANPIPADYKPQPYPRWLDGRIINSIEEDPTVEPEAKRAAKDAAMLATEEPALVAHNADLQAQLIQMQAELQAMRAEMLSAAVPKNKGGRPRKAPPPSEPDA